MNVSWYLDKVVVSGNYITFFLSGSERGETAQSYSRSSDPRWTGNVNGRPTVLDCLETPGKRLQVIRYSNAAPGGTKSMDYNGIAFTFENVTGRRFTLSSDYSNPPLILAEITLGEPDE